MLQPIITSGIKIKTTFDTSTPAITAAISPIPATMANTPKTFSPVRRTDLGYPRTRQLRGRLPAVHLPQHADRHRPVASGPPRSRSGVGEGTVCGFAGTSLTTEVLLWTIRRIAVGLGLVLVLLGVAMLVNFARIDAVAAETVPLTSDHFDEMAGRGVRRVRYSGSHWRGHQPHLKRGSALDSPLTPRSASPEAQGRASLRW